MHHFKSCLGAFDMKRKPISKHGKALNGSFMRELIYAFAAVLVINSFVLASFEVPTGSMEDTVRIGDHLFVNKLVYGGSTPYTIPFTSIRIPHFRVPGFRNVARGDVIVFDWPGCRDQVDKPAQKWYLKRCVALPGDTIRILQRVVYVNGEKIRNPNRVKFLRSVSKPAGYWNPDIFPRGARFNEDNYGPIVVPRKGMRLCLNAQTFPSWEVFVRREGHTAELTGGRIIIDGRETSCYTVNRDYLFAMGDNRDDSLDSRFWGFVPPEDVIGTPILVYWSWDPKTPIYDLCSKLSSINLRRLGTIIR
jgi:signal peptidase I